MPENSIITLFAKTNFRNREVPFGIKTDDRRRHMYLIGKTGMGKTTLMENMVIQDIRNGHGVAFLDPHGDSVQRILDSVPSSRVNDVVYFNPADMEYPLAFNILESVDAKYKHLVASGLMGVFTKIWANLWSARMEYILNNTILALLDSPGNTLLGITRMYVDKKYRKKIVDNIKDPMVRAFWVDEFANYNEKYRTEAIAPIQNKVGQFLSSGIIRNIVGQPKSTIDLRDIMDKQKILIMDLSKGKVGEDNSALLGAMLVTKLQLAAMSRTDIDEKERKDFYLYVDEFQNFATESFATILSEARKYRLNLIVGHQYIAQLEEDKNTKVRDAIFGNVGTIVVFRIGAADAEYMETEFEPTFTPNDLVNLPKYQIILKLMINGVASQPFSAITLSPNPEYVTDNGEKVIKVSRERYTNPVAEVEEKISRWMGSDMQQESASQQIGVPEKANPFTVPAIPTPRVAVRESQVQEIKVNQPIAQADSPVILAAPPRVTVTEAFVISSKPALDEPKRPDKIPDSQNSGHRQQQRQSSDHQQGHGSRLTSSNRSSDQDNRHLQDRNRPPRRDKLQNQNRNKGDQRKVNPIWETVGQIQHQKRQEDSKKIQEVVGKILGSDGQRKNDPDPAEVRQERPQNTIHNPVVSKSPENNSMPPMADVTFYAPEAPQPTPASESSNDQISGNKTIMKPGEVHKI